jgi:hypothetical protein
LQGFLSKRVDALALSLCFDCQSFVQLGRDTQVELAGEIAPWFKALLFTHVEEDLERLLEFGPKFLRVLAVKISAAIQTQNFTSKEIKLFVVFDLRVIPLSFIGMLNTANSGLVVE